MIFKQIYSDEYKGIRFGLVKWGEVENLERQYVERDYNPIWNVYLYIDTKRIPDQHDPKSFLLRSKKSSIGSHKMYNYWKHPVINSIEFHGGITFYEPLTDGWIKIGCDYNHYQDHHSMYSFQSLMHDARWAIDSFLNLVPDYKMRCSGNGKLYDKSEGIIRDNVFCSKEYFGDKQPEWFNKETKCK